MLTSCTVLDIHVPCITFDGQWFKIKDETVDGKLLTIFQLQRNHWAQTCAFMKEELLNKICNVHKSVKVRKRLQQNKHFLILESHDRALKLPANETI